LANDGSGEFSSIIGGVVRTRSLIVAALGVLVLGRATAGAAKLTPCAGGPFGTKVYENFDWAHAIPALFEPPLVVLPGDWIDYECLHDNGVTRPVKLDASGNPTDLRFGVTTDDEMCILPGLYYDD
jgi:hypothetical protein